MTFIPSQDILRIGDRIRLTRPVSIFLGTFTIGHEFTIVGHCERGWEIRDDDGNYVREIALHDRCEKIANSV